jgi:hypothetical protein
MALPRKIPEFVLVALVCLMIGYGTGSVLTERKKMVTLEHSIALKWSDGVHENPPLGAHVFLEPHMDGVTVGKSVRLRIYIGREQPQFYMPGRIGQIDVLSNPQEAVRKWRNIEWRKDGLHVGVDGNRTRFFVPHSEIRPMIQ